MIFNYYVQDIIITKHSLTTINPVDQKISQLFNYCKSPKLYDKYDKICESRSIFTQYQPIIYDNDHMVYKKNV